MSLSLPGRNSPIAQAVAGAVGAGFLWWKLDRSFTVNDVGWLTRLGPPWSWIGAFVAAGAALGWTIGRWRALRARNLRRGVGEIGEASGLEFVDGADDLAEQYAGEAPDSLFPHWHSADNRLRGTARGLDVEVFDLTDRHVSESSEGGTSERLTSRTVVLLPGIGLPDFELRGRGLLTRVERLAGVEGLTFDPSGLGPDDAEAVSAFVRIYRIDVPGGLEVIDDRLVRRLFPVEVLRALASDPGWSARCRGGDLAMWRGWSGGGASISLNGVPIPIPTKSRIVPAGERPALVERAETIAEALERARDRPESSPIVPPRPGGSLAEQGSRAAAAGLGGCSGGIFGFFGGFALFASWMISHKRMPGPASLLMMPVLSLGGSAVSALVGASLARRFVRGPAVVEKKVGLAGGLPFLGLFLGFFLGGLLGMAAAASLTGARQFQWLLPLVFFGGAAAGAGLGLFLGGLVAFRRMDRRKAPPAVDPQDSGVGAPIGPD